MIRMMVMVKLKDGSDAAAVEAVKAGFTALNPPGCASYTLGDDIGLRDGNWSLGIVGDFTDEASYRAYDLDAEHNRLRGELAPYVEQIARVQFRLEG